MLQGALNVKSFLFISLFSYKIPLYTFGFGWFPQAVVKCDHIHAGFQTRLLTYLSCLVRASWHVVEFGLKVPAVS